MQYGWIIIAVAFVSQGFATGFFTYSFGLLVLPMEQELNATRAQIMSGVSMCTLLGLVYSPVFGRLVDKWSVRGLLACGALSLTLGLWLMSISQTVTQLVLAMGLFVGAGVVLLGPLTNSALLSRWFTSNRGRAMGLAAIGTSVGGIIMPALFSSGIADIGWRGTLQATAVSAAVLLIPAALLARDYPPSATPTAGPGAPTAADDLTFTRIVRMPAFWWIGLSIGLLFMVYAATLANLPAYTEGLGHSAADASRLIMVIAVCGLIGKILFGIAADRISQRLALWLAIGLATIGVATLILQPPYQFLLLASASLGLAAGGMLPVWGAMLASVFGVVSYGRAMGLMQPVIALLIMQGFLLAGAIFDHVGNYATVMMIFTGLLLVSALLLVPLRMPVHEPVTPKE